MNQHYAKISNEPNPSQLPARPPEIPTPEGTFQFRPLSELEVTKLYNSMKHKEKKTPDINGLASKMLNLSIGNPATLTALTGIINASLTQKTFPTMLKTGIITPVPKIAKPKDPIDYRPVQVQSFLSLIIEKTAHNQLANWLNAQHLIHPLQFGFRAAHSCETAIMALMEYIYKQIDRNHICILVSIDMSKAFDTIVRPILYEKLRWYGIDPTWFESYLCDRAQAVKGADGNLSEVLTTIRGTPQGSVMGPLLFLLYINDLPLCIKDSLCTLFADDNNILNSGPVSSLREMITTAEHNCSRINEYLGTNGLKQNADKTQVIVLGSPQNLAKVGQIEINVAGKTIHSSDTLSTLGLKLDGPLTFRNHINGISKRFHLMAKSLFPLKPSLENFILLANACVISLTDYLAGIWGSANKIHLKTVVRAMRNMARRLHNVTKFDSISSTIKNDLKWLMPEQRYLHKTVSFVHQILTENKIPHFEGLLTINKDIHNYGTRSAEKIHINTRPKNSTSNRSVRIRPVVYYNQLPLDLRKCENVKTFRKKLKYHILNSL